VIFLLQICDFGLSRGLESDKSVELSPTFTHAKKPLKKSGDDSPQTDENADQNIKKNISSDESSDDNSDESSDDDVPPRGRLRRSLTP